MAPASQNCGELVKELSTHMLPRLWPRRELEPAVLYGVVLRKELHSASWEEEKMSLFLGGGLQILFSTWPVCLKRLRKRQNTRHWRMTHA